MEYTIVKHTKSGRGVIAALT